MNSLLKSRKFWLAVFAVAQTVLFNFIPDFPPDIWQAIDVLVIVLIAAIAAEDMAHKVGDGIRYSGDK